jgi:hypothetical protein
MHSPSNTRETHAVGAASIMKDAASVQKGLARRHLGASCMMRTSRGIFES